jgi:hypothetical protein
MASFHIPSSLLFAIIKYDYEWRVDEHEGSGPDLLMALLQHLLGGSDANFQLHKGGQQGFWPRLET